MNNIILKTKNLFKTYNKAELPAVNNVSISLQRGKIYALMGSSGCGKTTLLNLIGTLDNPDKGDIFYEDKNYKDIKSLHNFRSDTIGFIFQFHHLIPILTLQENVQAAMIKIKDESFKIKQSKKLLCNLKLASKLDSYANSVSGGEKQRAAIARALANKPKLILADEPTGNVDSKTTSLILNELKNFITKEDSTMLIATHDNLVSQFADIILKMDDGKIISEEIRN